MIFMIFIKHEHEHDKDVDDEDDDLKYLCCPEQQVCFISGTNVAKMWQFSDHWPQKSFNFPPQQEFLLY